MTDCCTYHASGGDPDKSCGGDVVHRDPLTEDQRQRLIKNAADAAEDAFAQRGFELTRGQMYTLMRCAAAILREIEG